MPLLFNIYVKLLEEAIHCLSLSIMNMQMTPSYIPSYTLGQMGVMVEVLFQWVGRNSFNLSKIVGFKDHLLLNSGV